MKTMTITGTKRFEAFMDKIQNTSAKLVSVIKEWDFNICDARYEVTIEE